MARDLDPALQDAIDAPVVRPFLALHVDLPDPVWAWTGIGTIPFAGASWTGIGGIATIDTIGETAGGSATGVTATLYQVPADFRDDVSRQAVRGALVEMYFGALDETFQRVVGSKLVWKGRLERYDIQDSGEDLTVTIGAESRSRDQRRPTIKRFTDEYQQRKYPGDRFFEYVPRMAVVPILWAKGSQDPL